MRLSLISVAVCVLLWGAPVTAQDNPAISFEHLTVATTAVNLASTPTAQYCNGIVETGDIRLRVDGTAATATVGALAEVGAVVDVVGQDNIRRLSAIRDGATSGALPLTCYAAAPDVWAGGLVVTPPNPGESTTGTGAEVHAASPTLTGTVTLDDTTLSLDGATLSDNFAVSGEISAQRLYVREDFEQGFYIHQNDQTVKGVADTEVNIVHGGANGWIYSYREELAKTASSWIVADGTLDITADNTVDNEGVEIVVGHDSATTTDGVLVAGTQGACFAVKFTITLIAGTDQFQIGWRDSAASLNDNAYAGYTVWNTVGINNVDGSIFSSQEVSEATDTDDSGVNAANADVRILRSCISAAGVPTAAYTADNGSTFTEITMTNTGSTLTAGTQLVPYISYMQAGGAVDAGISIDYWEVTGL